MIDWFLDHNNQDLVKTILVASGFGISFFLAKGAKFLLVPFKFLYMSFTTELSFNDTAYESTAVFNNFSRILSSCRHYFSRSFTSTSYITNNDCKKGIFTTPAQGWFICVLEGRLAFIKTDEINKEFGLQRNIHVIWFTRNKKRIDNLFKKIKFIKDNEIFLNFLSSEGRWVSFGQRKRRSFESTFYNDDLNKEILDYYRRYEEKKEVNNELGIINKSVKLFYGPPGTGKTSLAMVIASVLNKDLFIINSANVNDDKFIHAITDIEDPKSAMFLFEDVDNNPNLYDRSVVKEESLFIEDNDNSNDSDETKVKDAVKKKTIKSGNQITLATFLNFLDGPFSIEGMDVCISTNHLEKLDPAIYRDSRVNFIKEITLANTDTVIRFIEYYYKVSLTDEEKAIIEKAKSPILTSYLMDQFQKEVPYKTVLEKIK